MLNFTPHWIRSPEAIALKDKIAQLGADIRQAKAEKKEKVRQNPPNL